MTSRARRSHGFTLLEVLVAFLILTLSLSILLRIFSASFASLRLAERQQAALLLAESQLSEVLATFNADSDGEAQGKLRPPFRWHSSIGPYEFPNREPGLAYTVVPRLIRVTVSWGDHPAEQVSLSTLRLVEQPR